MGRYLPLIRARGLSTAKTLTSALRWATDWWNIARQSWFGYRYGRRWRNAVPLSFGGAVGLKSELEEYFDRHDTGPGIWKWQHYFSIYDRHFARFRGRQVHVLEVGVYSGGSLEMWRAYFGEGAHIYGVDIDERCRAYERSGVRVFIGDQADPEFWTRFRAEVPVVDIVIDDGGHQLHQRRATLEALLPHIQPGGVYVCEDIHGRFNPFLDYVQNLSRNLHSWRGGSVVAGDQPTDFQQSVDSVHVYPFLVVIEKRAEPVPRLVAERRGNEWLDS